MAKIALTLLIIAVVFLLGQRSAMAKLAKRPRKPRAATRGNKGIEDVGAARPMTDLILCRRCGRYHDATSPCDCGRG